MFGVTLEGYLLVIVVFDSGVEQPHHARVDHIVQVHMNRQVLIDTDRNRTYQRQMLQDKAVPFWFIKRGGGG